MYSALIAIHLIVSVIMILVVIFQSSKGSEMGAVFGGGASQTAFGSQGAAGFLEKTTIACAVIFMLTSLSLAIFSTNKQKSLIQDATPPPIEQTSPEPVPGQAPAPSQSQSAPTQAPATATSQPVNAAPQQAVPGSAGSAPVEQAAPAAPVSSAQPAAGSAGSAPATPATPATPAAPPAPASSAPAN